MAAATEFTKAAVLYSPIFLFSFNQQGCLPLPQLYYPISIVPVHGLALMNNFHLQVADLKVVSNGVTWSVHTQKMFLGWNGRYGSSAKRL
jgi:hypothetical protein